MMRSSAERHSPPKPGAIEVFERDICTRSDRTSLDDQKHVDDFGGRGQAAAAQTVEHGLENMGECDQRLKAEYAGAALDRVNATKHRIDRIVRTLDRPRVR